MQDCFKNSILYIFTDLHLKLGLFEDLQRKSMKMKMIKILFQKWWASKIKTRLIRLVTNRGFCGLNTQNAVLQYTVNAKTQFFSKNSHLNCLGSIAFFFHNFSLFEAMKAENEPFLGDLVLDQGGFSDLTWRLMGGKAIPRLRQITPNPSTWQKSISI